MGSMVPAFTLILWLAVYLRVVIAQGTLTAVPRTIPLVNRSPYFSLWTTTEDTTVDPTIAGTLPITWSWRALNWTGYVRVDGQVWQWLGNDTTIQPATATGTYLTATRTTFTMDAGPMALNVSFLSPVEPTNLVQQSFPFAYVYVDVKSKDGQAHSVQLYTDVDASLISTRNDTVEWNTTVTSTYVYHELRKDNPFDTDSYDVAESASLYLATPQGTGVSRQTGTFSDVRSTFISTESLDNSEDGQFRASQVQNHPVIALAIDLGNIESTASPVVWAIGEVREDLLSTFGASAGIERRRSYFWSQYTTIADGIEAFLSDFNDARTRAENLDIKLKDDASRISSHYADLVSLSLRQTMGSIEISLPRPGFRQSWNTSDIQAFVRDNGVSKRANPVEVIYAAMPALLYLNPNILWYLLKPLLNFQSAAKYQNAYAAPDLGNDYLYADGNFTNTKQLGVENSGSMLIMAAAYGMQTKDWASLNPYAKTFKTWADFLVVEALRTKDQMSADGLTSEGQSNLALKGILGIYAMSKIRENLGANGEEKYFLEQATNLTKQWEQLAIVDDHISSVYGQPATWGLTYNAFAVNLIAPDLFTKKIWRDQTDFYGRQAESAPPHGLPYDTADAHVVKSHWTMFTAAAATSASVRDKLIDFIHTRAFRKSTASQFATTYNADTGASMPLGGRGSPAQGAMFALLAPEIMKSAQSGASAPSGRKVNIGGIVGGVIGALAILALLGFSGFWFWRRRKINKSLASQKEFQIDTTTMPSFYSPEIRSTSLSQPMSMSRFSEGSRLRHPC
ncbi:hypothetical protein NMY22_g10284 [Coprinellus aureogranulatus]|nr:hypothetical protein NMY22_g10284 [Coprinellus aureogranulatus]